MVQLNDRSVVADPGWLPLPLSLVSLLSLVKVLALICLHHQYALVSCHLLGLKILHKKKQKQKTMGSI